MRAIGNQLYIIITVIIIIIIVIIISVTFKYYRSFFYRVIIPIYKFSY